MSELLAAYKSPTPSPRAQSRASRNLSNGLASHPPKQRRSIAWDRSNSAAAAQALLRSGRSRSERNGDYSNPKALPKETKATTPQVRIERRTLSEQYDDPCFDRVLGYDPSAGLSDEMITAYIEAKVDAQIKAEKARLGCLTHKPAAMKRYEKEIQRLACMELLRDPFLLKTFVYVFPNTCVETRLSERKLVEMMILAHFTQEAGRMVDEWTLDPDTIPKEKTILKYARSLAAAMQEHRLSTFTHDQDRPLRPWEARFFGSKRGRQLFRMAIPSKAIGNGVATWTDSRIPSALLCATR